MFRHLAAPTLLALLLAAPVAAQEDLPFRVIVHADNPVDQLDPRTVARMFLGKQNAWGDGVPVEPVDQERLSATRAAFSQAVHGMAVDAIMSYWQRVIFSGGTVPPQLEDDLAVLEFVATHRGAIGYVSTDDVSIDALPARGVKVVSLSELDPEALTAAREAARGGLGGRTGIVLTIDPQRPDVLYAAFPGSNLLRSTDGGITWAAFSLFPPGETFRVTAVAVDPRDPRGLAVATDRRLLVSEDGGASFHAGGPGLENVSDLLFVAHSPSALFALKGGDLLRSRDRGRSFELLTPRLSAALDIGGRERAVVTALAASLHRPILYAAASPDLLRSDDGGDHWRRRGRIERLVRDLAIDPRDDDRVFVATSEGVLRSDDGGASFRATRLSDPVRRLRMADDLLYALTETTLWVSRDGGLQWFRLAEVVDGELAVDPLQPGRVLVADGAGDLVLSGDGGQSWRRADPRRRPQQETFSGSPPPPPPSPPNVLKLACGDGAGHVAALVALADAPGSVLAGGLGGIWRSEDDGAGWRFSGAGLEVADIHRLAVDRRRPEVVWAASHGGGLVRSDNRGASWGGVHTGLGMAVPTALRIDPDVSILVQVGGRSGILRTEDDGATWMPIDLRRGADSSFSPLRAPIRALADDPDDPTRSLLATAAGLQRGDFRQVEGEPERLALAPGAKIVVQDCGEGGKSAGQPCDAACLAAYGIDPESLEVRDLEGDKERGLSFAATAFGVWRRRGEDGPWRRLALEGNVADLALAETASGRSRDLVLWAATSRGLWWSTDGGDVWRRAVRSAGNGHGGGPERAFRGSDPVHAVALGPQAGLPPTVYAGLNGRRVLVGRWDAASDTRTWSVRDLPPSPPVLPVALDPRAAGGRTSWAPAPGAAGAPGAPKSSATSEDDLWWRRYLAVPSAAERLRGLIAVRMLRDLPDSVAEEVRGDLAEIVRRLEARPGLVGASFDPTGSRLVLAHRFDDGLRVHDELRVFELAVLREEIHGAAVHGVWSEDDEDVGGGLAVARGGWHAAHDLAHEPPHLRPSWILPDAGEILAWSPDGALLATAAEPGRVHVWPLGAPGSAGGSGELLPGILEFGLERGVELLGGNAPTLELLEGLLDARRPGAPLVLRGPIALSPGGGLLAFASRVADGAMLHFAGGRDRSTRTASIRIEDSPGIARLLFTPNGRRLISLEADGAARAWDVGDLNRLAGGNDLDDAMAAPLAPPEPFHRAAESLAAAAVSPDGRFLALVADRELLVWPLSADGPSAAPWRLGPVGEITELVFGPGSAFLLTETRQGETWGWDLRGERPRSVLQAETDGRLAVFAEPGEVLLQGRGGVVSYALAAAGGRARVLASLRVSVGPLESWDAQHRLWLEDPDQPAPTGLSSPDRRWHAEGEGTRVVLWDLAAAPPRAYVGGVGRNGPVGGHADAWTPPPWRVERRRTEGLGLLSISLLRDTACERIGREMLPEELLALGMAAPAPEICPAPADLR